MRKRIKIFLTEKEESVELNKEEENKEVYLDLLIKDLKDEAKLMPKYSLWHEMVNKCLNKES